MVNQREQAAKLSTHTPKPSRRFNYICYDDDDDYDYKESTIPLNDIISQEPSSNVITTSPPMLLIEDPEVSLIMRNEEINTIPEKKLDEFIKSSVEDLIPIPSESEDKPGSESVCNLPLCDNFSPNDILEEKADIECKDSYDPNLDESTFLVTPLSDFNEDEYFTPGDDVELLLHHDPSIPKMGVASILEGFTEELPLEENDDLFDLKSKNDDWKKILYDAQIDDLMSEDKVFNPGIHDQIFSPTYVSLPFTDRQYLFFTYVVRIFLPHITYPVVSPFLISSGSEDTTFDPGISAFHFSHRIGTFISFNDCPNFEDSRARGFVHPPIELLSLAYRNPIS
nr:hypothetical protein [Tanacetum cinerariifolium]